MKTKPFNYEIAAIAEALYGELSLNESSRSAWAYSLYYVLMKFFGNNIPEPQWEQTSKQWNIVLLYRGAKNAFIRAQDCPNDPICIDEQNGTNVGTCYACSLVPEISCEKFNTGLDRKTLNDFYDFVNRQNINN